MAENQIPPRGLEGHYIFCLTFDSLNQSPLMMDLKHTAKLKNGVFYVEENGEKLADMTYVFAGDTQFIIDHLEVLPGNEERDLGKLMVEAAVDFARKKRLKIVPLSPFAKGFFDKTPDYADVLA